MTGTRRRIVVIGHGMAGSRFVRDALDRDPEGRLSITVLGAEAHAPYNRVLLSEVLAGRADATTIRLTDHDGSDGRLDVRAGVGARSVDRAARTVSGSDGSIVGYDTLVFATGSRPFVPPLTGLDAGPGDELPAGVEAFRTLADAESIIASLRPGGRAVVVGGGLLGLEAARGIAGHGMTVDLVHSRQTLMERQLDVTAGRVLSRALRGIDVGLHLSARSSGVRSADGRISALELDDGVVLPCELLILACGVRPEVDLAGAAGLALGSGILVDDALRSVTDPDVTAIGECAEHAGRVYGLVAPAWEHARIAADLITGADPGARYAGSKPVTRLKAADLGVASMGEPHADPCDADEGTEVVQFADASRGTYKKVVVRGDRLVGAILLGDLTGVGTLTQLYDRQTPVPPDRVSLLFVGTSRASDPVADPAHIPDRATLCHCNGVSKGALTAAFLHGARTVQDAAKATRATTGCGGCRDAVDGVLCWLAAAEPDRPDSRDPVPI